MKDHQAGGKICTGSSPSRHRQPQGTGSRAGGWAGREDPKPRSCHPHPCPCCQSWGCCCLHEWKRGKKEKRKGKAARGHVGGAGSIPNVTCPPKPLGPLLGAPWGCNRLFLVVPGCKPHLSTQTAPAHMHRHSTHIWHRRPTGMQPPPRIPLCPRLSLSRKGMDQTPKGEHRGKL